MPYRPQTYRPPGVHPQAAIRQYEGSATRLADKRFYASARWLKLRLLKLTEDPLCEPCRAAGRLTPAVHVHHVKERKDRPDLALDYDNLESVCQPCHNAKRGKS